MLDRGAIAIVVSHKVSLLSVLGYVGRVHDGRFQVITRDEYRQMVMKAQQTARGASDSSSSPTDGPSPGVRQQITMLREATTGQVVSPQTGEG